ncbi:MAG: TrpR-related protein YerC/YecD [Oscillospiraceae bacterium]|jgi:TrpR-related protein YerC/YecD|nr:TrpR-related protein YerC/YecD [Oscillospiraceae bacterium]MBQ5711314.1 TrpR-related protein YerC/YecD [Oscillospiraceae bacterium]
MDEKLQALYQVIADLQTPEEVRALFSDLCTHKEIEKMAERIQAAKLLLEGKTYQQVMAQSNISSATLSRVSRCVQYGDGYRRLLNQSEDTGSPS